MTAVLALDLSLASTGVCSASGRLATITPTSKGDSRLNEIVDAVLVAAGDCSTAKGWVDLVVLEDVPPVRSQALVSLGKLHGAVRYELNRLRILYLPVTPAQVKTYATGRGNATKPDMRVELLKRTEVDVRDDNQVDAQWLWYLAHDLCGEPVLELPKMHRRALDKLTLPEGVRRAAG